MAEGKTRIYALPDITAIDSDMYIMLDSGAVGARRYNLKTLYDRVDEAVDAAHDAEDFVDEAQLVVVHAQAATEAANGAAQQAQSTVASLVSNAQSQVQGFMSDATETMDGLVEDANAAIDAMGDISELAVPLMTTSTRGGAKLGRGLAVEDGALTVAIEGESDGSDAGPIVELTAKGWAEQDGTPSPDSPVEIQVARGRNLLPNTATSQTNNGVTFTVNEDGSVTVNGTASATTYYRINAQNITVDAGTYTLSGCPLGGGEGRFQLYNDGKGLNDYGNGSTITIDSSASWGIYIRIISGYTCNNLIFKPQLERGSTATPYVPYGCVGVDVYDGSTHVTTIPVPLPSRGWVGALPDGTADVLTLDGAGGYVWECVTNEVVLDGSETWGYSSSARVFYCEIAGMTDTISSPHVLSDSYVMASVSPSSTSTAGASLLDKQIAGSSIVIPAKIYLKDSSYESTATYKTWLSTHPVTVLYPLANPTTESGYVDLPEISDGATLSCAELDGLHVKYCADSTASELARQWYMRARSEYEGRLSTLESIVAGLV